MTRIHMLLGLCYFTPPAGRALPVGTRLLVFPSRGKPRMTRLVYVWTKFLFAWSVIALLWAAHRASVGSAECKRAQVAILLSCSLAGVLTLWFFTSAARIGIVGEPLLVTGTLALLWFAATCPVFVPRRQPAGLRYRSELRDAASLYRASEKS